MRPYILGMSYVLPELPRIARYGLAATIELASRGDERLTTRQLATAIDAPPMARARPPGLTKSSCKPRKISSSVNE